MSGKPGPLRGPKRRLRQRPKLSESEFFTIVYFKKAKAVY
jgi:hypothetical protein